jgi:hypothetical protein
VEVEYRREKFSASPAVFVLDKIVNRQIWKVVEQEERITVQRSWGLLTVAGGIAWSESVKNVL